MIKKEAAKIVARQGKGEKKQKKKESLVGAKYYNGPQFSNHWLSYFSCDIFI